MDGLALNIHVAFSELRPNIICAQESYTDHRVVVLARYGVASYCLKVEYESEEAAVAERTCRRGVHTRPRMLP